MQRDIRGTTTFGEAKALLAHAFRPGKNFVSDMADLQRSDDPTRLLFTGTFVQTLDAPAVTRVCRIDLASGTIEQRTAGPGSDRHARLSHDGSTIAFLSDRGRPDEFQLFYLDPRGDDVLPGPTVPGSVEYIEWSPDDRLILLGVARSGEQASTQEDAPDWMPHVTEGAPDPVWRSAWICDVAAGTVRCATPQGINVWEASWFGNDGLIALASGEPEEGTWYNAALFRIDIASGAARQVYAPRRQVAFPRASREGMLAFVEGVASDRGHLAGDLRLCDPRDGTCRSLATDGVDVTCVEWHSDDLLVAGHRGLETVVLSIDPSTGTCRQLWADTITTTAGPGATVIGLDEPDAFAFVREGFFQRPHIATVRGGVLRAVAHADPEPTCEGTAQPVSWQSSDGLTIEGWLLRPVGEPPFGTILHIHGGPVLHWRPHWLARAPEVAMLLRRGNALFLPNPRGSSGRGQGFAECVMGDIGGVDTRDFLSGIDHLVSAGLAHSFRLGVMGLSYGGLMSCWLPTQDPRFRAAVAVGPATNHVSHHLLCDVPQFVSLFLEGHYSDCSSAYHQRSPVLHAHRSRTPTLLVCGDLDRCTPAEEAVQFHAALRENGVPSVVVRYPREGHGVHGIAASIDFAARCVMWFDRFLTAPATAQDSPTLSASPQ